MVSGCFSVSMRKFVDLNVAFGFDKINNQIFYMISVTSGVDARNFSNRSCLVSGGTKFSP